MRDAWNCDETCPGWEGLNMLTLRLTLSGFRSLATYDLWALRDTLERGLPLKPCFAMIWWVRGSRLLYEVASGWESELPSGNLWTGGRKISAERWAVWENRVCLVCEWGLAARVEDTRVSLQGCVDGG